MTQPAEQQRRPGRPRDTRADAQILAAAQEIMAEVGVGGLSVEQVADRAGVAKTTVYRRWGTKDELVVAAIEDLYREFDVSRIESLEAALEIAANAASRLATDSIAGRILPQIAGEVAAGTAAGKAYLSTVIGPRLEIVRQMLRKGVDEGSLRADLDVDLATASLGGTFILLVLTGQLEVLDETFPTRLIDQLLNGWRPATPPEGGSA